jgi:hypothetical protein
VRGLSLARWGRAHANAHTAAGGGSGGGGGPTAAATSSGVGGGCNPVDLSKEADWKAMLRTRRMWSALALADVIRGTAPAKVCARYGCTAHELEELRRSAKLGAGRVQRFCAELGWAPLERLICDFKTGTGLLLDHAAVPPEIQVRWTHCLRGKWWRTC